MSRVKVMLWGLEIGAVIWDAENDVAAFQYSDKFCELGIELSPLHMPVIKKRIYRFKDLNIDTFWALPGLISQSLPDKFGNDIINKYISTLGKNSDNFTPVDRLQYIGNRGMGAIEFLPDQSTQANGDVDLDELISFCRNIITRKNEDLVEYLNKANNYESFVHITTSAGGAKAKALLAFNPDTEIFEAGDADVNRGFQDWLIKFDHSEPEQEYLPTTRVEYAYYLQALASGIQMSESRLLSKDGCYHFMTKRFDRIDGQKVLMQSLCNLFHLDFSKIHPYEQAMALAQKHLGMGIDQISEIFRIAVFNVVYRNEDDHSNNISFIMGKDGKWSLAPAYDLTYGHVPSGGFHQSQHQMSVNGKTQDITLDDLMACALSSGIKKKPAENIIHDVISSRSLWSDSASASGLSASCSKMLAYEILRKI